MTMPNKPNRLLAIGQAARRPPDPAVNHRRRPNRSSSTAVRLLLLTVLFDVVLTTGGVLSDNRGCLLVNVTVVFAATLYSLYRILVLTNCEDAVRPDHGGDERRGTLRDIAPDGPLTVERPEQPTYRDPAAHRGEPEPSGGPADETAEAPATAPVAEEHDTPFATPSDREQTSPVSDARTVIPPAPRDVPVAGDGRDFPVLADPSRAADAPWRLPSEPTQHAVVADGALLGELDIRAASVVGPGHRLAGVPRQDAYRLGQDDEGRHLIIAVADGMSDARHSEVGANAAVVAVVEELRRQLNEGKPHTGILPGDVFRVAAGRMAVTARAREWEPDDVRAVAIAAVVPVEPDATGCREVWLACVGDPSAYRLRNGLWECLLGGHAAGAGEAIADNRVHSFLPFHDGAGTSAQVRKLSDGDVLAVMTDGVADALEQVPGGEAWFAGRWRRPPSVGAFLMEVGYKQVQMQDDRTAVAVWFASRGGNE